MSNYICTITQVTIHREGDNPLCTPEATVVSLADMGGGCFLVDTGGGCFLAIKQHGHGADDCVLLDPEELPKLQEAAQLLLDQPGIKASSAETLHEMFDELDARGLM
jgi:hypothetical protein